MLIPLFIWYQHFGEPHIVVSSLVSQSGDTSPTLVMTEKIPLSKNLLFWPLAASSADCFASFHHSMLLLFLANNIQIHELKSNYEL
jgi:hypothetical protein